MAASPEEDAAVLLDRSSRATRGKRMTKLLDEEIDDDEQFWNQDALKEDENDDIYEQEGEVADEFDSDFEEDEPDQDDEAENVVEERLPLKKRLIFPGKQISKKKSKKKVLSKLEITSKVENDLETKSIEPDNEGAPDRQEAADDLDSERVVRKSTRTSVVVRQAERDAIRAALQASIKPIKRKKEGEEKRMTQEEMLLKAAETEIINLRNLERVLAREEEVKKRAVVNKAAYSGPQIHFFSRNGENVLGFSKGASFESEISTTSAPYPQKAVCAVTGLPAKYRDPKSGLPYATKEAFKIIRERFLKEESESKRRKNMDMGDLLDSISDELGFPCKRRRSEVANAAKLSDLRLGARFRRIPSFEDLDLE